MPRARRPPMCEILAPADAFIGMQQQAVAALLAGPGREARVGAVGVMDYQARTTASASPPQVRTTFSAAARPDRHLGPRGPGCTLVIGGYLADKPRDQLYAFAGRRTRWSGALRSSPPTRSSDVGTSKTPSPSLTSSPTTETCSSTRPSVAGSARQASATKPARRSSTGTQRPCARGVALRHRAPGSGRTRSLPKPEEPPVATRGRTARPGQGPKRKLHNAEIAQPRGWLASR